MNVKFKFTDDVFFYSEPSHVHRRQAGSAPVSVVSSAESPAPTPPSSTSSTTPSWGEFPEFPDNKTFTEHDILTRKEDYHKYYNTTYFVDPKKTEEVWVNMNARKDVQVNNMLSDSHRRAAVIYFTAFINS